MANEIKIGINSIDSFKVGAYDCQIYLGTVKLYPNITPVTTPYFTFVVRDSQAKFKLSGNTTSYSLDSGNTWTNLSTDTWSPVVASGSTIMWKATNPTITTDRGIGRFSSSGTGTFDVEGNIMSLLYGDNYEGQTALQGDNQFRELFDSNTKLINASGVTLPATAMTANCYRSMFGNCTNLVSGPTEFPATTLADGCYRFMFARTNVANAPSILPATTLAENCYYQMYRQTSITTAPSLPATTLADFCYYQMFSGCTSLTTAPDLPATAMTDSCYYQMFYNCTSLTTAPQLPATTLATYCYSSMFQGCTSLTTAPVLSANTLAISCYDNMFRGCTSLTTAPELPATTLAGYCYRSMFNGCTSLTTAPVLSATSLINSCYNYMFDTCTSLTYVKCLATTHLVSGNTNNMFNGITTTGTFERASGANWPCEAMIPSTWSITPAYDPVYRWETSTDVTDYCCDSTTYTKYYKDYYQVSYQNGCHYQNVTPEQWRQSSSVIEYDSPDCGYVPTKQYFTITSLAGGNTITLKNNMGTGTTSFSYSTDSGSTWSSFTLTTGQTYTIKATLGYGDTLMMYGTNNTLGTAYNRGHFFRGTGDYEISGEISSLVNGNNADDTELSGKGTYTFAQLFSGDTHLVSAENLKISSTALPESCFNGFFRGCTKLVKAPELPSTILGKEAYSSMFEGCIALSQPPSQLKFTSAQNDSYQRMFCMSRSSKITTPAMTYSPKMFGNWGSTAPVNQQMFCGNGNLANVYCYWTKSNHSFGTNMTNWLNYTNAGTFTKRSTESFGSGASGIPSNWTTVNDDTTQPT